MQEVSASRKLKHVKPSSVRLPQPTGTPSRKGPGPLAGCLLSVSFRELKTLSQARGTFATLSLSVHEAHQGRK